MPFVRASQNLIVLGLDTGFQVFTKEGCKIASHTHAFLNKNDEKRLDDATFSLNFMYFAALFSDKTVEIWKVNDAEKSIKEFKNITVSRRSTSLTFAPNENTVYVADKSGDLYSYSLEDEDDESKRDCHEKAVLGHVSMLLDVVCTENYLITADRDEKIRISNLLHPFVIEHFCFGHTEFVCRLKMLSNQILLSLSGDGTARLWNIFNGSQLQVIKLNSQLYDKDQNGDLPCKNNIPSVVATCGHLVIIGCQNQNKVSLFGLESGLLENICDVKLPAHRVLLDADFAKNDALNTAYILYKDDASVGISLYQCTSTGCSQVPEDGFRKALENIPTTDIVPKPYNHLFKPDMGGKKYTNFYKKKEEGKVFSKGTTAKKIKIDCEK